MGVQVQVLQYCNCLGETRGVSSSLVTSAALGCSSSLCFGSGINISRNLCFLNQSCLNSSFCLRGSPGFISVAGRWPRYKTLQYSTDLTGATVSAHIDVLVQG